jgi:hypothetical protein
MFKFAKNVKAQVKFKVGTASHEFGMEFKWLAESERAAILKKHDEALQPEEDKEIDALGIAAVHAAALAEIATGWDLRLDDDSIVPWDESSIATVLDHVPGLFFVILDTARQATSAQAIRGN